MKAPYAWAKKDDHVQIAEVPPGAKVVSLALGPRPSNLPMILLVSSISLVFLVTWLDALFPTPAVRSLIMSILNFASLHGTNFVPDAFWEPFSCMWLHGGWMHLSMNMLGLIILWTAFRNAVSTPWWLAIFLVGGALANVSYLHTRAAMDFSDVQGPLISVFWQPNSPMAGASGGVFTVWGAFIAFALRYQLKRETGMVNRMVYHWWDLLIPAAIELIFIDPNIEGVAWQAHLAGIIIGFGLGFIPPLYGNVTVNVTRREIVTVKSVVLRGRQNLPSDIDLILTQAFDPSHDAVIMTMERSCLLWRSQPITTVICGSPATASTRTVADSRKINGLDLWKLRADATGHQNVEPFIA